MSYTSMFFSPSWSTSPVSFTRSSKCSLRISPSILPSTTKREGSPSQVLNIRNGYRKCWESNSRVKNIYNCQPLLADSWRHRRRSHQFEISLKTSQSQEEWEGSTSHVSFSKRKIMISKNRSILFFLSAYHIWPVPPPPVCTSSIINAAPFY